MKTRKTTVERVYARLLREAEEKEDLKKKLVAKMEAMGKDGLGLVVSRDGDSGYSETAAVLYRTNVFVGNVLAALDTEAGTGGDMKEVQSAAVKSIVGMVGIDPPESGAPCNGAWQVSYIAGRGYSAQLHDIALQLSPTGEIMPDRNAVSNELVDFYRRMVSSRGDIKKKRLDSIELPPEERKTPDPGDDCDTWRISQPKRDVLDTSFSGTGSDMSVLQSNHREAMRTLSRYMGSYLGMEESEVSSLLSQVGGLFFTDTYSGVPQSERGLK
jgi:hypothetical protein